MSSAPKKTLEKHPVALGLDGFEELFQAAKKIAITVELDEHEGERLANLVDDGLEIYDAYCARLLEEIEGGEITPEQEELKETIRQRLLLQMAQGDDENLQKIALESMNEDDLPQC